MSASSVSPGRGSRTWIYLVLLAILLTNLIPSLVIGFGFVIPGSCIDGINPYTMGFIATLIGFIPTYVCGVWAAWKFGAQSRAGTLPAAVRA